MNPTPAGWPRITASLYYDDAPAAIEWLGRAFGFEVRLKVDGPAGTIRHSELTFGDGVIMVSTVRPEAPIVGVSPRKVGGSSTASFMVYVDDVEGHCARARAAGGNIIQELATHDHGEGYWVDRGYGCEDPEGHRWWFSQRISAR
jgi:uncharacterized glyoxalase superfamily protein PhnB